MHGTLPSPRRPAAKVKKAILVITGAVIAAAIMLGAVMLADSTALGHQLLIRWGFEYPPDCG